MPGRFVLMKEEWKDITAYQGKYFGKYQVSNLGNVKSLGWTATRKYRKNREDKVLKLFTNQNGYHSASLCADNKKKSLTIHRVVALTWIPNPLNLPCVNHINGIKTDNRVENLEWCTRSENAIHSVVVLGKRPVQKCQLSTDQIKEIKLKIINKVPNASICRDHEISLSTLGHIRNSKYKCYQIA